MSQTSLNFSKQLIKGKVAEMIFEQMLRDTGRFTVLGFGYEKVLPELMHRQADIQAEVTMEIIRRAPDFAIINNDTHEVHLIEVKFRARLNNSEILKSARQLSDSWKPAYLFVATPEGFYFGQAMNIVKEEGRIAPLDHKQVSKELQDNYLELLGQFIDASLE